MGVVPQGIGVAATASNLTSSTPVRTMPKSWMRTGLNSFVALWGGRTSKKQGANKHRTSVEMAKTAAGLVSLFLLVVCSVGLYYGFRFACRRPQFASAAFFVSALIFQYFNSSSSRWHQSQDAENRFWMVVWGFIAWACIFLSDSPLPIRRALTYELATVASPAHLPLIVDIVSCLTVVLVSLMAHFIDKHHHRRMLAHKPVFRRRSSDVTGGGRSMRHDSTGSTGSEPSTASVETGPADVASDPTHSISDSTTTGTERKAWKLNGVLDLRSMTQEQKLQAINECMNELPEDNLLPSRIYGNSEWVYRCERRILYILRNTSQRELNYLLDEVNLRQLIYRLCNHNTTTRLGDDDDDGVGDWGGESVNQYRNKFLDLVTRQRASDLSTSSRALVLDAIQVNNLMLDPSTAAVAQRAVANLLLSTTGDALSELKTLMDGKGSIYDTHKLIYQDIHDTALRAKVLSHIERQAKVHKARMAMGGAMARRLHAKSGWRKVLSDVDDTLISSGGRYPAGIECQYPRHQLYPGAIRFNLELDLGTHPSVDNGKWPDERQGNLVSASARPHVYKGMTEQKVYAKFEKMWQSNGLHCMPTLLPGDLESGQAFILHGDFEPMACKKMKNFEEYHSLYPEYRHVFIGDNGQADVKAGQLMVEKFGDAVEKVFMHIVQPISATFGHTPKAEQLWRKQGMVFFRTYVGAAVEACVAPTPLIRPSGLLRVGCSAVADFEGTKFSHGRVREVCRLELNADIIRANRVLASHSLPQVPVIKADCSFKIGESVYTTFGPGYVESFRADDGIYGVVLDWHMGLGIRDVNNSSSSSSSSRHVRGGSLDGLGSVASARGGGGGDEDDNQSLAGSVIGSGYAATVPTPSKTAVYLGLGSVHGSSKEVRRRTGGKQTFFAPKIKATGQYAPNAAVTLVGGFGRGVVRRYRRHDSIFEVRLLNLPNTMVYVTESALELEQRPRSDSMLGGRGFFSLVRRLTNPLHKPSPRPNLQDMPGAVALRPGSRVVTPFGTGSLSAITPMLLTESNEEAPDDGADTGAAVVEDWSVWKDGASDTATPEGMGVDNADKPGAKGSVVRMRSMSTSTEVSEEEEEEEVKEAGGEMATVLLEWGAVVHMPVSQLKPAVVAPKTPVLSRRSSLFSLVSGPFERATTMLRRGSTPSTKDEGASAAATAAAASVSLAAGSNLDTLWGDVQVLASARESDRIIHVQLPFGQVYLNEEALLNLVTRRSGAVPRGGTGGVAHKLFTGLLRLGGGGRSDEAHKNTHGGGDGRDAPSQSSTEPHVDLLNVNVDQIVECAFGVGVVQKVQRALTDDEQAEGVGDESVGRATDMVQLELAWGGVLHTPLETLLRDMAATAARSKSSGPEQHTTSSFSSSIMSFLSSMMPVRSARGGVGTAASPALDRAAADHAAANTMAVGSKVYVRMLGHEQEGTVVGWRLEDQMYQVELRFGQAFVHKTQLVPVEAVAATTKLDATESSKRRGFLSFFGLGPCAVEVGGTADAQSRHGSGLLQVGDSVNVKGGLGEGPVVGFVDNTDSVHDVVCIVDLPFGVAYANERSVANLSPAVTKEALDSATTAITTSTTTATGSGISNADKGVAGGDGILNRSKNSFVSLKSFFGGGAGAAAAPAPAAPGNAGGCRTLASGCASRHVRGAYPRGRV